MSLLDAVTATGPIPADDSPREMKKAYSETLSRHLAQEVAAGLRRTGFPKVKPQRGGLGPKKVDISYSDEQHGCSLRFPSRRSALPVWQKPKEPLWGSLHRSNYPPYALPILRGLCAVCFSGCLRCQPLWPGVFRNTRLR